MKKQIHSLLFALTLTLLLGVGVSLNAQQPGQAPQTHPPQTQDTPQPGQAQQPAQEPAQQPQAQPGQTPDTSGVPNDSKAQPTSGSGQTFTGTIMKSGDKYVLQDASGTSYDLDNQEAAKKFEGKKVKIQGTMDPNGKLIHIQ